MGLWGEDAKRSIGGNILQIKIEFCEELAEPEITIKCREKTALIDRLVAALQMIDRQIMVSCEGNMLPLALGEILYIESVDGKTFLYTQGKIYESPCKLYELEERLEAYMFVRTWQISHCEFRAYQVYKNLAWPQTPDYDGKRGVVNCVKTVRPWDKKVAWGVTEVGKMQYQEEQNVCGIENMCGI